MNIDIYNAPAKSVMLMCHTSKGDPNDKYGKYFEAGKEYRMGTEIVKPSRDTNNQECILCWIEFNVGFGSRFAVKGNVSHDEKAYWPDFKDHFICPVARVRKEQLEKLCI
jgi:rubredoxin